MELLLNVNLMLSLQERNFVKANWDVDEAEVGGSLSVRVKSRFWVHEHWNSFSFKKHLIVELLFDMDVMLGLEEVDLIQSNWNINETEVSLGLGVFVEG